jgi:DNA-binding response OmpR family regulator
VRILVVEDYAPLRAAIVRGLSEAGHEVDSVTDGLQAAAVLREQRHDLVILDLMLPSMSGEEILTQMRAHGDSRPVLILTAKDEIGDRIAGLNAGADDYLGKPFDLGELIARVHALERRSVSSGLAVQVIADLRIDRGRHRLERAGRPIHLTATEYTLLLLLADSFGTVVTRERMHQALYGTQPAPSGSNIVDVYIGYLRRKIDLPDLERLIHTRRGQGYMLGRSP